MSDEITTEVLAKATDKTTDTARSGKGEVTIEIGGKKDVTYVVIDRVGSDKDNALNAVAIAPKKPDGTPDYNNVAVVFAGTNNANFAGGTGKSGTPSAAASTKGLSWEALPAARFLEETLKSVADKGGRVTDVSGFSQSGGYLMKLAAKYAPKYGFTSTSFDDFGGDQYKTLTKAELEWLKKNPKSFRRYQNSSWAQLSGRDSKWGSVVHVTSTSHETLAKYFDGNELNLDRLAKDGILAPGMSEEQVRLAAKKIIDRYLKQNPHADRDELMKLALKNYLKKHGSYGSGKSKKKSGTDADTVGLKSGFAAEGSALIDTAIAHLEDARRANDSIPDKLEESYRRVLQETSEVFSFILDPYDVEEEAHRLGLQPEHHMDRAAISRVSAEIGKEIEELEQLKATLRVVSSRRKQLDSQQATKFRVQHA